MKKIDPVHIAEPEMHESLLAARRPAIRNQDLISALSERFGQYDVAQPFLQPLAGTPAELQAHARLLKGLYNSTTQVARRLRVMMRSVENARCPYCGRPYPTTLDHFLPQSIYPEFSMYYRNLIPSCPDCNLLKLTGVWDDQGKRLVLNPYCDAFLELECIHVLIVPDEQMSFHIPQFEFEFDWEGCTDEYRQLCRSHFKLLEIPKLLRNQPALQFRAVHSRFTLRMQRETFTVEDVRQEIDDLNRASAGVYGVNCWDCLLHRAILRDDAVLQFLATETIQT